ncbi:MAG: CapA family protein [Chloroflexi bacterium]|nr:CapA family protein [Chloroflexota bacterium]
MTDKANPKDTLIIHLAGDVSPRRIEYGEPPESIFALTHLKIKEADIRFCHVERSFSTRGCMQYRDRPTWYGRHHPDNVKALVFAGFDLVSHASNNCFDYGPEALLETLEVLRRNNIQVVGAGKDLAEARTPVIMERKGIKVGFLAYCSVMAVEYEAREGKPGCAPIRVSTYYEVQDPQPGNPPRIITIPLEEDARAMEEDIRKLRGQVDILIVSQHWGTHQPGVLSMYESAVGHRAIEAGADLIVGHHPGIIKGIEIYKGKVIVHSTGNFALETPHHLKPPPGVFSSRISGTHVKWETEPGWERYPASKERRYCMMIKCVAGKRGIEKVSFIPAYINRLAEPEFVSHSDPRFGEVVRYAEQWCKELGTNLTVEGDEVVVLGSAVNHPASSQ